MIRDEDLPALIRANIPSVWALELLLLLKRTRERRWPVELLTAELRGSSSLVSACLQHFVRCGLVMEDDDHLYMFSPATDHLQSLADTLEQEYRARPVRVINTIAAPADPVQKLADAFRVGGKPK